LTVEAELAQAAPEQVFRGRLNSANTAPPDLSRTNHAARRLPTLRRHRRRGTPWGDGKRGAHIYHDANFLTFHRIRGFRHLTIEDSVVDPASLR
jgi:hypothetical protein